MEIVPRRQTSDVRWIARSLLVLFGQIATRFKKKGHYVVEVWI
jgi:hypothetical protein